MTRDARRHTVAEVPERGSSRGPGPPPSPPVPSGCCVAWSPNSGRVHYPHAESFGYARPSWAAPDRGDRELGPAGQGGPGRVGQGGLTGLRN